ncbi:recombinase family protein [Actinomadura violacea]|uniref:Recombinase family protein n=1 Tax=Actinomadura violacea TaxID=2819934 RepID=A0ABS3RXK7_9ACTN|nr:recombinase family protein [Actinomadura violacea]MBO2461497.1 recombinase family protein [Actinomadura violacea]
MFEAPIDLSDLPNFQEPRRRREERIAFLGRCSTKDQQDPGSSLAGQVADACTLLEEGQSIAAYFFDVESGMLGLDDRGEVSDADYERLEIPVPRAGGVNDLLEAVERGEFTRVICERISRAARNMLTSLMVEDHLKRRGITLECANEPRGGMESGRLQARRTAQVHAEVARHEMVEMSMRGQRQHAANGYRHGYPCYGYIAVEDPDAAPTANRFGAGRPKCRLALHPDGRRADTVREVFRLRRDERLGDADIAAELRRDPGRYPQDPGRRPWRGVRVAAMLAQPKYTGFMVYNRRATSSGQGRWNPISEWVWSREPAHPAIVTPQYWAETQKVTAQMRRPQTLSMARVIAVARERDVPVRRVRGSDTHTLYEIAGHQVVVPRGDLPSALATELLNLVESL